MPGEKGESEVKYDTNIVGVLLKAVTSTSTALETRRVVRVKGLVKKPS